MPTAVLSTSRIPLRLSVLLLLAAAAAGAAQVAASTWDGVYSEEQALDGEGWYQDRCAGCHLPDLSGGEVAPELAGAQFGAVWQGRSLDVLVDRMEQEMPQEAPGSLRRDQYAAIAAFLLQRNGFPSGTSPLPGASAQLKSIRYAVKRP